MAKGNQVLINEMEHLTVQGSGNNTSPGGRDYPSELIFTWQNGTDTVRISLGNLTLLSSGSSTTVPNFTTIRNPEYMRLTGNGVLNVNLACTNETFDFPAIWEVNYGH